MIALIPLHHDSASADCFVFQRVPTIFAKISVFGKCRMGFVGYWPLVRTSLQSIGSRHSCVDPVFGGVVGAEVSLLLGPLGTDMLA